MARGLKPREVVRTYAAHLKRSGQELFYRSNSSDAGLSSSAANSFSAVKSVGNSVGSSKGFFLSKLSNGSPAAFTKIRFETERLTSNSLSSASTLFRCLQPRVVHCAKLLPPFSCRSIATAGDSAESSLVDSPPSISNVAPRIKFKRLDKTARHIMQIMDKEAVEEAKAQREIPDIRPGYIVQLKVEVPENKRRVSIMKGIVIARRNAGLNTTFRIRRLVAGVGVESLFPLYSPNIKEIKVLDKKKVRRAKLYYLRDKMNALKRQ